MTNPGAPPSQPVSQAVGARPGLGPPQPDRLGGGAEVTFSRPKTASKAGAGGGGVEFPGLPRARSPHQPR